MITQPSFIDWFLEKKTHYDAVVFDIDGVLTVNGLPVPGAATFLKLLEKEAFPFSLLTNDDTRSPEEKVLMLSASGINISPDKLTSCAHGLRDFTASGNYEGDLFFLMGHLGDPCYAEKAGLAVTKSVKDTSLVKGIIINDYVEHWEIYLNAVLNHIITHRDVPVVVPNPDTAYPDKDGKLHIGPGGLVHMLESVLAARGVFTKFIFLGKPHSPIFKTNHHQLEKIAQKSIDPKRVIMVGDNIESDIIGANRFGYVSALMLTGITNMAELDERRARKDFTSENTPDFIFETF